MRRAAIADRSIVELAWIGLCVLDQLFGGMDRKRRVDDEHIGLARRDDDRCEILLRVVRELRIQMGAERQRPVEGDHHGVAVGRRFCDQIGCGGAARRRPIFDDDRLPQPILELVAYGASEHVERAPRWRRNDELYRPVRPRLAVCATGQNA